MGTLFFFGRENDLDKREELEEQEEPASSRPSPGKSSRTHGGSVESSGQPGKVTLTARLDQQVARIDRKIAPGARLQRSAQEALKMAVSSIGRPLPDRLRELLEQVAAADLSDVRIHTGPESDRASRALGARAFTAGKNIYFAHGEYDPVSSRGQKLIAHEVAHALQQRELGRGESGRDPLSPAHGVDEKRADAFAERFAEHARGRGQVGQAGSSAASRLPDQLRADMERAFGRDLGDVEVHEDSPRAQGSTLAVTEGNELHFGKGKFQPGTPEGDWLIGHELAHMLQQREGAATSARPAAHALEAEADRAATQVAQGGRADVSLGAPAGSVQAFNEADEHAVEVAGQAQAQAQQKTAGIDPAAMPPETVAQAASPAAATAAPQEAETAPAAESEQGESEATQKEKEKAEIASVEARDAEQVAGEVATEADGDAEGEADGEKKAKGEGEEATADEEAGQAETEAEAEAQAEEESVPLGEEMQTAATEPAVQAQAGAGSIAVAPPVAQTSAPVAPASVQAPAPAAGTRAPAQAPAIPVAPPPAPQRRAEAPASAPRLPEPTPPEPVSVQPVPSEPQEPVNLLQPTLTQPSFNIQGQGQSGTLPAAEPVTPEAAAAQAGVDLGRVTNMAGAVMQDPSVTTARSQAETLASTMASQAAQAGAQAGAQARAQARPSSAPTDSPAQQAASLRQAAIAQAGAARAAIPALPGPSHVPAAGQAGGPGAGNAAAPGQQPNPGEPAIERQTPTEQNLPAAPAQAFTPAPPATPTPQVPAPQVAPVRNPGGESVPSPAGMVQPTVSLAGDRAAHAAALQAEVATKRVVPPNASAQREAQIAPLPAFGEATFTATTEAPHASIVTTQDSSFQTTQTSATTGMEQQAQIHASNSEVQRAAAQAEQEFAASQPPPPVLAGAVELASAVQADATATSSALVAAGAADPAFVPPASTSALIAQAQGLVPPAPTAQPDTAALTAEPELPAHEPQATTRTDAASQVSATRQALQQPIPPVQIQAPSSSSGGPAGSREAAIARVESELVSQTQAQAGPAMENAAAPRRQAMTDELTQAQTEADAQIAQAQAQEQAVRAEVEAEPPPVTEADVQAQAQAQWDQYQTTAEAETATMQQSVTQAQADAEVQHTQAGQVHQQAVQQAEVAHQAEVTQAETGFTADQAQAQQTCETSQQVAADTLAQDQAAADATAQQQTTEAQTQADTQVQTAEQQHQASVNQAEQQYQSQTQAAEAEHQAQVAQIQADEQTQSAQIQADMDRDVAQRQQQGQTQSNQHLQQGEQNYQSEIARGQAQADAEKARAEAEAEAKRREAESAKDEGGGGGIFGKIANWVASKVSGLLEAAASILAKARDLVVSIMEKARQAALAALEAARQAAQKVLEAAKQAIQGLIKAASAAIQAVIQTAANLIKAAIQATAAVLKACVEALATAINTFIEVLQTAVNAALDGLIAAVSLINEEWGQALANATAGFRAAFNAAVDQLQASIEAASQTLQAAIDTAAQTMMTAVDTAAQILKDAVVLIEQGLHMAVDAAFQVASTAIDAAFAVAEAAVNTVFAVAEAVVEAWFNAQIAALEVAAVIVEEAGKAAAALINMAIEHISAQFEALVELLPDSIIEGFIDFWNGPWREVIIIGLATIAAVAITVATLGTGAPVAAVLMAAVIGGTLAGSAYFAGEMTARHGETELFERNGQIYVTGVGYMDPAEIQIDPRTGQPVRPPGMSDAQYEQLKWAASNFNIENGRATAKSNAELFDYALSEGAEGFVNGAISSAVAMGGALAGGALAGKVSSDLAKLAINKGTSALFGMVGGAGSKGSTAFIEALESGASLQDALAAGGSAAWKELSDPNAWATAIISTGFKIGGARGVDARFSNRIAQSAANISTETLSDVLGTMGGPATVAFFDNLAQGKPLDQAWSAAVQAGGDALTPEKVAQMLFGNIAQEISSPGSTRSSGTPDTPTARPQGTDPSAPTARPQGTDTSAPTARPQGADPSAPTARPQGTDTSAPTARPQGTDTQAPTARPQGQDAESAQTRPQTAPTQEQVDAFRRLTENKLSHGGENFEQMRAGVQQRIEEVRATNPELARVLDTVPVEELMAIRGYTSHDYQALNSSLRGYVPRDAGGVDQRFLVDPSLQVPPQELAQQLAPYVALAEGGLARLPAYQGQVYRSMHIDPAQRPELFANYTTRGAIIEDAGFVSTSTNPNIQMKPDDNFKLIIAQESGREISWLSMFRGEQEVLFAPGTRFKVIDVQTQTGPDGVPRVTVIAEEVA